MCVWPRQIRINLEINMMNHKYFVPVCVLKSNLISRSLSKHTEVKLPRHPGCEILSVNYIQKSWWNELLHDFDRHVTVWANNILHFTSIYLCKGPSLPCLCRRQRNYTGCRHQSTSRTDIPVNSPRSSGSSLLYRNCTFVLEHWPVNRKNENEYL